MFRIHDVFQPPEITDVTDDKEVVESFVLLKQYLNGEVVPPEALALAKTHLPTVEVLLVDYYLDKIRAGFYKTFNTDQFIKSTALLDFLNSMCNAWSEIPLDLFSEPAIAQIKSAWSALVRSVVNGPQLQKSLLEYLQVNPVGSPQGAHIINMLCSLGLGPETWDSVAKVVPAEIKNWVETNLTGSWSTSVVELAENWLFNDYIVQLEASTPISANLKSQLYRVCLNALANTRIKEIFDMVLNFPESQPGLEDLKLCLNSTELRAELVRKFESESMKKLLNNGVATVDIFLGYLKYINAFSVLDPRGILLDRVSKPIREYLKNRSDSVTLIVEGLMGQEVSPLAFLSEELKFSHRSLSLGCNDLSNPNWMPDPINTPADFIKQQISDTISTLLTIFDNKDIISLQLTEDFARRLLLTQSSDELDMLCSKAEDLKRLFGNRQLQNIDVMIRDIRLSNSSSQKIHSERPSLVFVKGLVISKLYWPSLPQESALKLPNVVEELLVQYKQAFADYSDGSKQISWIASLGRVSVSVALEDRTIDLVVTPDQAVVLSIFESVPVPDLATLIESSGLPEKSVLLALRFWIDEGVVGSSGEKYHIIETMAHQAQDEGNVQVASILPGTVGGQNSNDMMEYWSYIEHMLTNVGELPADRIHQFLVMLVPNGKPYVKTLQELETFLDGMVVEEKLKFVDGAFSIA